MVKGKIMCEGEGIGYLYVTGMVWGIKYIGLLKMRVVSGLILCVETCWLSA
jgi:hypothetical protein